MKYTLIILLMCVATASAMGQNGSGIFLTIQCAKQSQRQTVMLTGKQVCLAPNPIILASEFTSITDVRTTGGQVSFDLTLSTKAIQTLMQISSNLPNSSFALVVEKYVFYVFPATELTVNRTFRFMAPDKESNTVNDMQKKIKGLITARTQ